MSVSPTALGATLGIVEGQPKIKLPLIGWFWPIGIESLKLEGDILTVGLDGWQDYTMKVNF